MTVQILQSAVVNIFLCCSLMSEVVHTSPTIGSNVEEVRLVELLNSLWYFFCFFWLLFSNS